MGKPRVHISKEELEKLYINENRSATQVAVLFNTTSTTIKNYLVKYDLKVKPQSEVMKGRKLTKEHRDKVVRTLRRGSGAKNGNWKGGETYVGRVKNGLYRKILVDGKYVLEHRYVMEQQLGRKLRSDEEVHHVNGNKLNNLPDNLVLLSKSDHAKLHNNSPSVRFSKSVQMQQIRAEKFWSTRKKQA